jgi:hypothetical protein
VTDTHQILARAAVVATLALLAATAWSLIEGRRTAGRRTHRFAVDRLVLAVVAIIGANDALGAALMAGGSRPADPLHLLYGVAAIVTLPLGWLLGGRRRPGPVAGPAVDRVRRDAWLVAATIVLLGIELRLFATG